MIQKKENEKKIKKNSPHTPYYKETEAKAKDKPPPKKNIYKKVNVLCVLVDFTNAKMFFDSLFAHFTKPDVLRNNLTKDYKPNNFPFETN